MDLRQSMQHSSLACIIKGTWLLLLSAAGILPNVLTCNFHLLRVNVVLRSGP